MYFDLSDNEDKEYPDTTGIDWLDDALVLAAHIIQNIMDGWPSGKAIVLKTIEA